MSAPLIVPVGVAVDGISLERYRRALMPELDEFGVLTVASTALLTTTPDAARMVTVVVLRSDGLASDRYDGCWLYVCDGAEAGEVRRVLEGTYEAGLGSLLLDRAFTSPLAAGTTVELCRAMPAVRYGTIDGAREVINLGIERLPLPDKVSVTITDNQQRYALTGYPWPIKSAGDVYDPRADADDPYVRAGQAVGLDQDGEATTLVLGSGFTTGTAATFAVAVLRPANTWIRSGGVWADTVVGLQDDDDEAVYDVRTVVLMSTPIALERMALRHPLGSAERAELDGKAERAGTTGALARWYGAFGSGPRVQRVGARGGRGSWWWTR